MHILNLIIILALIGLALWAVNRYIPMAQPIKTILNVVVVVLVILWLATAVFHVGSLGTVPRVN